MRKMRVLLWAVVLVTTAHPVTAQPKERYAREYQLSFQGKPANHEKFRLLGPDVEQCLRFEPTGLRLTLPAGPLHPHTGLSTGIGVQGDFEITVTFDVLEEPDIIAADKSFATKLHLIVVFEKERAGLTRRVAPWSKTPQWISWLNPWQQQQKRQPFPAAAKRTRLRMVREGDTLSYAVAEDDADFKVFAEYPCRTDDVTDIHLDAETGEPRARLDARLTDLRIRAAALPNVPTEAPPPRSLWKLWLALGVILASILGVALAAWRSRRARSQDPSPRPDPEQVREA